MTLTAAPAVAFRHSPRPRGHYPFTCDLVDADFGILLAPDFECDVVVDVAVVAGELETTVTDVLIEGKSLFRANEICRRIAAYVTEAAERDIEAGGYLWDLVREAEGFHLTGHPNDPDTGWAIAAE